MRITGIHWWLFNMRLKAVSFFLGALIALAVVSGTGVLRAQATPNNPTSAELATALDCQQLTTQQGWAWTQSYNYGGSVWIQNTSAAVGGSNVVISAGAYPNGATGIASVSVSNVGQGVLTFCLATVGPNSFTLLLYVDGAPVLSFGGISQMGDVNVSLSSGTHTLKWEAIQPPGSSLPLNGVGRLDNVRWVPLPSPTLTASASPTTATVNEDFAINGTLNTTDVTAIAGATITLQNSTDDLNWNNATTSVTDSNGNYQFSNSESAAGTYYYRTAYDGNDTYANATSNTVAVQVTAIPTQLSAAANPTSVVVNQNFTITGMLQETDGMAIADATVTLQQNTSGAWNNVTTNVTDANGNYRFSHNESAAGTYPYRTTYDGNATYGNVTSNVVSVTVKMPTQLSISANPTAVFIGRQFAVSGTLNTTSNVPIAGGTVRLQKNVSGIWSDVTGKTNITGTGGGYYILLSASAAGTFDYRATYAGNDTSVGSNSSTASVAVNKIPTQLSATGSLATVTINKQFTISGTLNATDTPIAGAAVQLQKNVSGTWTNVTGKTSTTATTGAYRINTSEAAVGNYQYRTTYAGNDTYAGANSTSIGVKVVSKASVLQDLVALGTTVNNLPSSAFAPGTKVAALAVIRAAEINVGVSSYSGAATALKAFLLARTDGCAANGKPDSNDWVRTCVGQGALYPQVQQVIQEIQALQGVGPLH